MPTMLRAFLQHSFLSLCLQTITHAFIPASNLAPATLGSDELPPGKQSAKRQERNMVQSDFGTGVGPELVESGLSSYISTIWGERERFQKTVNSAP